jgi:transposase
MPGIDVESYEASETAGLMLDVEAALHSGQPSALVVAKLSQHLHQNHWHLVRDLPLSHYRKTWLRVNRRQFKCTVCGKPFSEDFEFMGTRRSYTDRYAERVGQQVIHSNSANVAQSSGLE